jgi:hypothetical protein
MGVFEAQSSKIWGLDKMALLLFQLQAANALPVFSTVS